MLIIIAGVWWPLGVGMGDFEIDIGDCFLIILFLLLLEVRSPEPFRD